MYTGDTLAERRLQISAIADSQPPKGIVFVVLAAESYTFGADTKNVGFVGLLMPLRTVTSNRKATGRVAYAGKANKSTCDHNLRRIKHRQITLCQAQ